MTAGDSTRGFDPPITPVELQQLMAVGLDTTLYDVATACLMTVKSTDASLPDLCEQAMATRRKVSIPACRVFGPHGCMKLFLSLLGHPESLVREQAVDLFRYVGGDDVLSALKRARQDPSEIVQMFANRAVRALEGPAGRVTFDTGGPIPLEKLPLREPTPRDRAIALVILGRDLGATDPAFAVSLLTQSDHALREAALRALETNASYKQAFYDHRARRRRPPGEKPAPLIGLLPGDRARDALLVAARDGDRRVREASLARLKDYSLEGVRDDLVEILRNTATPVDEALTELLERAFGDDGAAFLRLYLEDEGVRRRGGAVLGAIAGQAALPALTAALDSPFREVRESAMSGLGRVPHPESFRLLLRFLEPPYGSRTRVALEACAELFSSGVEPPADLMDFLRIVVTGTSGLTRQRAFEALASAVQLAGGSRIPILALVALLERLPEIPPGAMDILAFGQGTMVAIIYASTTGAAPEEVVRRLEASLLAWRNNGELEIQRGLARGLHEPKAPPLLEADPGRFGSSSHLSTTAPRTVAAGSRFVLGLWVHGFEPEEVLRRARAMASGRPISLQTKFGSMPSGQTFEVSIELPGFELDEARDTLFWEGRRDAIASCTFAVSVPANARFGTHLGKAAVWLQGLRVAKLDFSIEVGAKEARVEDVTMDEARAQTAFASYANEELPLVLARIQGMQRILPDLDVFLDVISLRSGEDWQRRIAKEIVERDLFLLFWSVAASKSFWVDREWRAAFEAGGLAAISPVPLQPAATAPPPPELSSLNFNDWTLALGQAWERGRTPER